MKKQLFRRICSAYTGVLKPILMASLFLTALPSNALNIVHPSDASVLEKHAAKEVNRYIFLRTGKATVVATADNYSSLPTGDVIVIAHDGRPIIQELKAEIELLKN